MSKSAVIHSKYTKRKLIGMDMCYQKRVSKLMCGVPVPEATTHVMSLLFSSSYEEVLEMLCSTCTSPGICMIFFRHWTQWFLPIFE